MQRRYWISPILVTSVKAQSNEGVTTGDLVSSLLKGFGRLGGGNDGTDGSRYAVKWKKLGIVVYHVFVKTDGGCTMLRSMNYEVKQQKDKPKSTGEAKPSQAFSIVDAASASVHERSATGAKAASSDKTTARITMHMSGDKGQSMLRW
nr:non-structural maintenance of chromosomes element 4 homolog A-like isoform X1 [Tanacetum cinerariifolium]